jgi:unconventional prefoldin RPB5 interactor 1
VPIGKRAMMPGKIVRSNEILAHLGDEYFAWKTAGDAVQVIERKKKGECVSLPAEPRGQ